MDLSILPELPLPPGYYLSRADDQVAVALANGAKRYVVLVFLGDAKRTDLMTGDDLADWYDRRLRAYGWQRLDTWRWRHAENQESLRLETGRRENSPTIRFLLRHRSTGMGA